MPTIIDSLIVEIGLDPEKWTLGQKKVVEDVKKTEEEVDRSGKKIQERSDNVADGFAKVTKGLLSMAAGYMSVSAISSFVQSTIQANVAVGQLATTLGISVERLSQYRQAARLANISPEAIVGSIQGVTNNLNAVAAGQAGSGFWEAYAKLGVRGQLLNANGQPISQEDFLRRAQEATRRAQAGGQYSQSQITGLLGQLGINPETAYVLERTDNSLEKFLETSKKIGVESEKQFAGSTKLDAAYAEMTTTFQSLGRAILEDLAPGLEKTYKWLKEIAEWFSEHRKVFETIAGMVAGAGAGAALGSFIPGVGTGIGAIAGGIAGAYTGATQSNGGSGTVRPPASGAGSSAKLAADRIRFAKELKDNPGLLHNFFAHAAGEDSPGSPDRNLANQGIMETAMNRASVRGTSLAAQLSYFQGFKPNYSAAQRQVMEDNLSKVLGGSDVTKGAIDNSSSWLLDKHRRTGAFVETIPPIAGEGFQIPGTRESHTGDRERQREWYKRMQGPPAPWGADAHPMPWLGTLPKGVLHDQSSSITNNNRYAITIGDVHTAATNAREIGDNLVEHMRNRMRTVQSTTGLA